MGVVALGFIQIKKEYKWNNWETIQVIAFDVVYTVFEVFYSDGATIGTQITTQGDLDGDCFIFFASICFIVYFGQDFIFRTS